MNSPVKCDPSILSSPSLQRTPNFKSPPKSQRSANLLLSAKMQKTPTQQKRTPVTAKTNERQLPMMSQRSKVPPSVQVLDKSQYVNDYEPFEAKRFNNRTASMAVLESQFL